MYSLLKKAESLNCSITEMEHAFRINGVIDIYKVKPTIYVIPENKYHKFSNEKDAVLFFEMNIGKYEKREDFKKTEKKRVSYQEFKHAKLNESKITSHAEDYHWNENIHNISDDHLYFIAHQGHIKIGRSKDVKKRISSLKTSLSGEFTVYYIKNKGFMETIMHKCFSEYRTKGEWFAFNARIVNFVKKNAMKFDMTNKKLSEGVAI